MSQSRTGVSDDGRRPPSRRSADPDEHRVRPVDLAELDGRAGLRGVDLQVAAGVDGHVSGPPHEVARLCLVSRADGAPSIPTELSAGVLGGVVAAGTRGLRASVLSRAAVADTPVEHATV